MVIEPKYDSAFIEALGDSPDVNGGYFKNDTITVYQNGEDGKELKRKEYASFSDLLQ